MKDLAKTSRIIAAELRQAERSINLAARDAAQFLLTTLDATEAHKLSPTISHRTVRATIGALTALAESQSQMAIRAHTSAEAAGHDLGLDVVAWGAGAPKASTAMLEESIAA
jgi:hypothetical protein